MNRAFILLLLTFSGCYRIPDTITPQIDYNLEQSYLEKLQPAFSPLSEEEKLQAWGKEYLIALHFAQELDLYRAISTFKRAEILLPSELNERKIHIQYNIILCYYLGKRYQNVIEMFEKTELARTDRSFRPFHDLLIILYVSYKKMDYPEMAEQVMELLRKNFPETGKKITLSQAFIDADLCNLQNVAKNSPVTKEVNTLVTCYNLKKKSIGRAKALNAFLPGSGYLYVGQKKSAATSFFLNALFITAAAHFFSKGQIAAGAITTSFEFGWYFGGIYGAGLEARYYNQRLYENMASGIMNHNKLFPVFSLQYGF